MGLLLDSVPLVIAVAVAALILALALRGSVRTAGLNATLGRP